VLGMLDEPKGTKDTYNFATAGWTAAPMVGRMIGRIGPLLGMMPVEEPQFSKAFAVDLHPGAPAAGGGARVAAD